MRSLRIAPCKGCPDRTRGDRVHDCHDTCERYQAFKAARSAENKARMEYGLIRSTTLEGMRRMKTNPPPGPDRVPCHSTCERYAAYKVEYDKEVAAHDKYWKVHGAAKEGARRRCTVSQSVIHGTYKERSRENGQKWPGERV